MDTPKNGDTILNEVIEYVERSTDDKVKTLFKNQSYIKTQKNLVSLAKVAVEADCKHIIVILLENRLNVNAALDVVVNSGKDDHIKLILDRGADVNEGLYFAVKANNKDAITFLLARGANINTKQRNGNTPLHTALMQRICDVELVEFLIKRGADTRVKTRTNKTALDLFQKFLNEKHDAETKKKFENIANLLSDNKNNNIFECIMGLPDGLSGYSYQTKIFTLYAIMNTKLAISSGCQYELSTEVKDLVPFDDIYLKKIQEGRTSCEFVQVKQTKKPEFNKISPSKFFTMLEPELKVKGHMKGNDSIVKIFVKFNEIREGFLNVNTAGLFIHCENTTFKDDPNPYFIRVHADVNNSFLCGIKHDQWIVDDNQLFIEIKYVLLNLVKTSPYFSIIDEEIKTIFNNQIQILEKFRNENIDKIVDDETLSSVKTIAMEGLNAIKKYLTYLGNCKREIENAIDTENIKKNLPDNFELPYTDDLASLIKSAIAKINEVAKSLKIDKDFFTYFSKFNDIIIREKIDYFVKHFSIYTDCPTSDELDEIITKEISDEFGFDIPILISGHCLQYFNRWISDFKNEKGKTFIEKDGKKLFHDIRLQIFNAFNKSYTEELQRNELHFKYNNENVIRFLNKDNNYKILHAVTEHTRLHAINILQTINNFKEQSTYLDHLNSVISASLEHIMKSNAHLKKLFDVFTLQDSNDLLILECSEDIEQKKNSIVFDYLKNITTVNARTKLIIISKKENQLTGVAKIMKKEYTSYNDTLAFKDLTDESQQCILKKTVDFLNNPQSIKTTLKIEHFLTKSGACEVIDENLLSSIITNIDDITIGHEKAFISGEYNAETFIPRYLLNIDVTILQECVSKQFFVTGMTKNDLITKMSINEQSVHIWDNNMVYNKGIVVMPHSHNVKSEEIFKYLTRNSKFYYWFEFRGELLYINRENYTKEYERDTESFAKKYKTALENITDKIVIIANDAGEGKSTMLTHLAHCMRSQSKNSWIIRVDLRNYADNNLSISLNDITFCVYDTTKAVEFITRMITEVDSAVANYQLERNLLKAVLNGHGTMEVILMFDGFDEISPYFKEKTCNLFKTLINSNIKQLWVTTRVHLKEYLEEELGVPARMLAGFSELDQMQFMTKFLKWQLNNYKCSCNLTEAERTLEIVKRLKILFNNLKWSMVDFDELLRNFKKSSSEFVEVQKFINNEIDFQKVAEASLKLWDKSQKINDFFKIPLHAEMYGKNVMQREWKHDALRNSLLFAIYTEFVRSKLEIYNNKSDSRTGNQYANDQTDIVQERFKKMHHEIAVRTLHSVSQVLPDLNICSEYTNFLEKLTRVGLVKFYGTRVEFVHRTFAEYFFSEYLVTHLNDPVIQAEFLENILLSEDYHLVRTFFDEFLLQYQMQDISEHVRTYEMIPNIMNKIIKTENNNENVLHVAVRGGHLQLFLLVYKNISESTFAKLVMKDSREGFSMLQLSIDTGHTGMSEAIVDSVKELMYSESMWETIKNHAIKILPRIKQRTLKNYPPNVYNIKRSLFADLALKSDNEGRTALHLAAEKGQSGVCRSIITAAKACSVLEKLIMCVDSDKKSALHYAAQSSNTEVIRVIIESIEENPSIFKKLLKLRDGYGQNVLQTATTFLRLSACYIIIKSVERYEGMIKYLLLQCDVFDKNTLHTAAVCSSISICKLLLETAEKHDLLKELIMYNFISRNTILHLAAERGKEPLCKLILETLKSHENLMKYLIIQQDHSGDTVLHIATYGRQPGICDVILNKVENCKEYLKVLIMQRDNYRRTALEMAIESNYYVICYIILSYAVKHEDVFRDVIMQCDNQHGRTALHVAAVHGYEEICSVILNIAKIHRNVLTNLIMQCDNYGYTALEVNREEIENEKFIKYTNTNTYTISELIQYNNRKEFSDLFISNILQSHYAMSIWLFRMKSKVKAVHTHTRKRTKIFKYITVRRCELADIYAAVLNKQSKIYDYISRIKKFNETFMPQGPNWHSLALIDSRRS